MFIGGRWVDRDEKIKVKNPYDGLEIDSVPRGKDTDCGIAVESAVRGAKVMGEMPAYNRYLILKKAAQIIAGREKELGRLITLEEGKTIQEGMTEAERAVETITLSSEEAKRIRGETIPLDCAPGGEGKFGFTMRVPCGVVVAITPFNFPLNLVCHKAGPALAAGNAVVLKPAEETPLSALKLVEILLEAGLPEEAIQCVTGTGEEAGEPLCKDPRVRKISFTGSRVVGEHICKVAGLKKITMELGSNSPIIIMPDADIEKVAKASIVCGYANAGQVCISAQRIIAHKNIYGDFLSVLKPMVASIRTGNPLEEETEMGPMIREDDAIRVRNWIRESVGSGAKVIQGGGQKGTMHEPTIVADVSPEMRIFREELFGPALTVTMAESIDEAISLANDSPYGLSAGLFTKNMDWIMRFVKEVRSGNLMIGYDPKGKS